MDSCDIICNQGVLRRRILGKLNGSSLSKLPLNPTQAQCSTCENIPFVAYGLHEYKLELCKHCDAIKQTTKSEISTIFNVIDSAREFRAEISLMRAQAKRVLCGVLLCKQLIRIYNSVNYCNICNHGKTHAYKYMPNNQYLHLCVTCISSAHEAVTDCINIYMLGCVIIDLIGVDDIKIIMHDQLRHVLSRAFIFFSLYFHILLRVSVSMINPRDHYRET